MRLLDVNVLVHAFRADAPGHAAVRPFVESLVNGDQSFGVADLVWSGFLRITTHPRIWQTPTPLREALAFVERVRSCPNCVSVAPGTRHFDIFTRLCAAASAKGNLIPDAYLAALAIESGSEWITADGDYARFTGLRWARPG